MEQFENEKEMNLGIKPKKKGKKFLIMTTAVVCIVLLLVLGVFLINNNKKTVINVNDYIEVEFDGYEGYGKPHWNFDKSGFLFKYEEEISFSSKLRKCIKGEEGIGDELARYCASLDIDIEEPYDGGAAELLYYTLFRNVSLSKTENLCNGDNVSLEWEFTEVYSDEELKQICDLFGVALEYSNEYKVSGLKEAPLFDPFEEVVVSFSGVAPNGKALLANYPNNGLEYLMDAPLTVKNGDEITVRVSYYGQDIETYVNDMGKMPTVLEKKYIVSGLPEYMTSASQIPEETLKEMQAQAEDVIKATTVNWISGYNLDISYIGNYMLFAKKQSDSPQNMFVLLYKMHYKNTFTDYNGDAQDYEKDFYFYVNWDDLVLNEDGTCSYDKNTYWKANNTFRIETKIYKDYSSSFKEGYNPYRLSFTGYSTLDEIYNLYITKRIENYKFEENVEE